MKKIITLLILFIANISFSQEKRIIFYGIISDDLGTLPRAHIINITTKKATFSNDVGTFKIFAKINDSLKITSVGYKTKIIRVNTNHFGIEQNNIHLKKEIIELDEVALKKHNLNGILSSDVKQTPEDVAATKSKSALDFSMIDFDKKVTSKIDEMDRKKAPNARLMTDPTAKFAGVGTSGIGYIDNYGIEKRRLRKEIKFKERFPKELLSEFGEYFFFVELKIPKKKYYHFLEYCNVLNIEELYKNGNKIEVIKILVKESKSYLKIIKK